MKIELLKSVRKRFLISVQTKSYHNEVGGYVYDVFDLKYQKNRSITIEQMCIEVTMINPFKKINLWI